MTENTNIGADIIEIETDSNVSPAEYVKKDMPVMVNEETATKVAKTMTESLDTNVREALDIGGEIEKLIALAPDNEYRMLLDAIVLDDTLTSSQKVDEAKRVLEQRNSDRAKNADTMIKMQNAKTENFVKTAKGHGEWLKGAAAVALIVTALFTPAGKKLLSKASGFVAQMI